MASDFSGKNYANFKGAACRALDYFWIALSLKSDPAWLLSMISCFSYNRGIDQLDIRVFHANSDCPY